MNIKENLKEMDKVSVANKKTCKLMYFIDDIEELLGKNAIKKYMLMQPDDVPGTWADVRDLKKDLGYKPNTPVKVGVGRFVEWYREF